MPGNRPNFSNQLLEMWSRLLWPQRLTIILFAFLGLALIGSVVYFMNRVEYIALYRDLNSEDAQAIAAKLKEEQQYVLNDLIITLMRKGALTESEGKTMLARLHR